MAKFKNLTIHSDGTFTLRNVVLSYEHCHKPWAKPGTQDTPAYSGTFIMPNLTHEAERKHLLSMIQEIEKEVLKKKLPADKKCVRDGELTGKDEYEDAWIFVAREREENPPLLVDKDGRTPVTKRDDKIYSGAVVNVRAKLWDQKNNHGMRVNANLLGVQFMEHGTKFGGQARLNPDEAFSDEDGGGDGDGFED